MCAKNHGSGMGVKGPSIGKWHVGPFLFLRQTSGRSAGEQHVPTPGVCHRWDVAQEAV